VSKRLLQRSVNLFSADQLPEAGTTAANGITTPSPTCERIWPFEALKRAFARQRLGLTSLIGLNRSRPVKMIFRLLSVTFVSFRLLCQ